MVFYLISASGAVLLLIGILTFNTLERGYSEPIDAFVGAPLMTKKGNYVYRRILRLLLLLYRTGTLNRIW